MTLLTAGELASLQGARTHVFDTSVVIQRNISGIWTAVATEMCSFSQAPLIPQENPSQTQRLFIDDRWRFLFAAGTDIRFGDRIVAGARKFEVIQVPVSSRELSRLAVAQELGA